MDVKRKKRKRMVRRERIRATRQEKQPAGSGPLHDRMHTSQQRSSFVRQHRNLPAAISSMPKVDLYSAIARSEWIWHCGKSPPCPQAAKEVLRRSFHREHHPCQLPDHFSEPETLRQDFSDMPRDHQVRKASRTRTALSTAAAR